MVQRVKDLTALADRWPEVGSQHQNEMAYNLVTSGLTCAQIHIDIEIHTYLENKKEKPYTTELEL